MDANFKTCLFGGFDKQSVVSYIESMSQHHRDATVEWEKELEIMRQDLEELREEKNALVEKAGKYDDLLLKSQELAKRLEQATGQLQALQTENEALRGPAEEYGKVKDHIAEIEITAHRRTEEFRAKAIAELRTLIENQRRWCGEERGRYENLNNTLRENLARAKDAIGEDGGAHFDAMLSGLQALEDGLQ